MLTGKFFGRLRKEIILLPRTITIMRINKLKKKFIIKERASRFVDSLSDFGRTMVSSYLKEHRTKIIPTRLR
jgi:hypothetical protein